MGGGEGVRSCGYILRLLDCEKPIGGHGCKDDCRKLTFTMLRWRPFHLLRSSHKLLTAPTGSLKREVNTESLPPPPPTKVTSLYDIVLNFYLSQRLMVGGELIPHSFKLMFIFPLHHLRNFLRPSFHC